MTAYMRPKLLLIAAMLFGISAPALGAEEQTVSALSAWQGQGMIYKVGQNRALFVGKFSGVLFVENNQGALHAGKIVCPGMVEIRLEDEKQVGEGRCIITVRGGDNVFAAWSCIGVHFKGCVGKFVLSDGTGKFQGISGGGPFIIRSAIVALVTNANERNVGEAAAGIAQWPKLKYKLP